MTLLHLDGFEGYGTSGAGALGQVYNNLSSGVAILSGGGRGGGDAVTPSFDFITPDGSTRIIHGMARKSALNTELVRLANGSDGLWYVKIGIDAVGRIYAQKADFTYFFLTDPGMRLDSVWRYYEVDVKLHASAGIVTVKVDGVEINSVTGVDTQQGRAGGDEIKRLTFTGATMDDLYVLNDTDTSDGATTFLGDLRMSNIYPNGAVTAAWSPSSAGANYTKVNETNTDGDASYVSATVVATEDKHDYQDTGLPGSQQVRLALMTSARRLADSGPRELTSFFDFGGHRAEGGVHQLSETYYIQPLLLTKHPFTGADLTAADVDGARAGYRLTA